MQKSVSEVALYYVQYKIKYRSIMQYAVPHQH